MDLCTKYTLVRRFAKDTGGNFMVMFGLAIFVIFLAGGLAFDYSVALKNKTRVNNALDAATLAAARGIAARELSADSENEVEDYLKAVFAANLRVDDLDSSPYSVDNIVIDTEAQSVSATASINQPLYFIKVGSEHEAILLASETAVSYGVGNVEVAMVLDVTGSMRGTKLTALQDSAKLGVDQLLAVNSNTDEKVRISIVPYAIGVNVGDSLNDYVYADYFGPTSNAPVYDPTLYDASSNPVYYDWATFQDSNPDCADTAPAYYWYNHRGKKKFEDESSDNCWDYVTESDGTNSDNCASDRKAPTSGVSYQYTDANPSRGMISRDARLAEDWCPETAIVPLTSNQNTLETAIDSFSAIGYTAGAIGLQWGWYTVSHDWANYLPSGSEPGDHTDPDAELNKYIIMMTDGVFNTAYADVAYASFSTGSQSSDSYAHFSALCTAIKSDNITIFSIGFELSDNDAKTALDNCATEDTDQVTYYYDVDGASELEDTFADIAKTIQNLRLTK